LGLKKQGAKKYDLPGSKSWFESECHLFLINTEQSCQPRKVSKFFDESQNQ
jgi:hypothetical protein